MQDRNIINATAGASSLVFDGFVEFLQHSKWFLVVGLLLIVADFRWGVRYAKVRKEAIRRSRAIRRTGNKIVDYICWIAIAYTLGEAFGSPFEFNLVPYVVMGVIYGAEIESVVTNYFGSKGKKVTLNLFKWINKKTDLEIEVEEEYGKVRSKE